MTTPARPAGAPCWIDLLTSDTARAESFYGQLFGWSATAASEEQYGGYVTYTLGDREVAGGMRNDPSSGQPDGWTVYLASEDTAATVASAGQHGGSVYLDTMPVPEVGVMAVVGDPGGAGVGVWQAQPFEGFAVLGEPGTPAWFELHTRAYDAAVAFYRDVFGWDTHVMSDEPTFRYTTLGKDDEAAAGIMDASGWPEDVPSMWHVYFAVEDCDAACAKATELGGSVVNPPEDTPYGRLATVTDPMGATFKLMTPPAG